mmetsp:Transcript_32820/g.94150  ORF Transcript_32820/g.94150 Transcript_32820/m.94150 type:complete len:306 (+) Transcript_32820:454-1371(+)
MPHEVADAAGHVQPRVARVLGVDPVVGVAIEHHAAARFLDPRALILEARLVVAGKRHALQVLRAGLPPPEHRRGVGDVSEGELALDVVVDADRRGGPRHLCGELLHAVRGADDALRLFEHVLQHLGHLLRAESRVLHEELRKVVLDEIGYVMSLLAMPIEHTVHRVRVHLQGEPRVLVRALRLETLAARMPEAAGHRVEVVSDGLEGLVGEGSLSLICMGADAHPPAAICGAISCGVNQVDDALLVQRRDEAAVLVGTVSVGFRGCALYMTDTETAPLSLRGPRLRLVGLAATHRLMRVEATVRT